MSCAFAVGWWSPAEPARAPGLLRWYSRPCHSGSTVLSHQVEGGHYTLTPA